MNAFRYYTFSVLLTIVMFVSCNSQEQYREQEVKDFSQEQYRGQEVKDFSLVMTAEDSVISANVNGLGFALLKGITSNGDLQSSVFSPLSAASVLAMTINGTSGLALQDLEKIIGSSQCANDFFRKYIQGLPQSKDNSIRLNNLIAVDQKYPLNDSFVNQLQDSYQAVARNYDFSDIKTVSEINDWMKGCTEGRISEAIDKIDDQEGAIMINTLRLKSRWSDPFSSQLTKDRRFVKDDGDTIMIPMMYQEMPVEMMENDEYQALAKELELNHFKMLFVLPKKLSLSAFSSMMNLKMFYEILDSLQFIDDNIKISIPKFTVSSEFNYFESFKRLMPNAFGMNPDLTKMTPVPARINRMIQKSALEVMESGVEATSVTTEIYLFKGMSPSFCADHPFFYFIYDDISRTILFMGQFCGN